VKFTPTPLLRAALRGSLREDPDVIMVGEMRDLETISLAITGFRNGHLVMGRCTRGMLPAQLDRLLDVFPGGSAGTNPHSW